MSINFKERPFLLFGGGVLISTFIALVVLILFWPQRNPFVVTKVTVTPGLSLTALSEQLSEKNIISNDRMFRWAVKIMGKEKEIPIGTFRLVNANSNYAIIKQLVYGSPEVRKVRLLEGWTMKQIAEHLSEVMGFDTAEILELANDPGYLSSHGINGNSTEGFLFPDTYFFFDGDSPKTILDALLTEYKNFWTLANRTRAQELKMTENEVVTLASIIEGEAIFNEERPIISGVYHNRLNRGMRLEADPTIQYIIEDGPRRLLDTDLKIDSRYNTYLHKGLPPGPVNSPGKKSLTAALYPEENEFLFFVAKGDGRHTFTRNIEDHNRAKREFQKIREKFKRKNQNK